MIFTLTLYITKLLIIQLFQTMNIPQSNPPSVNQYLHSMPNFPPLLCPLAGTSKFTLYCLTQHKGE